MARLLPPESAALEAVAHEIGVGVGTLERWRSEAAKSVWCRAHGVYPQELADWRAAATQALAEPEEARASPQATKQDRRRIKELERELRRKDRALAETAALLVLSKKVAAIFNKGEDE